MLMEPSKLFCFKDTINFVALLFFLSSIQQKIPAGKHDSYSRMVQMNPPDNWMKRGWARDSQTHTQLMDSLFYIMHLL